MPLRMRAERDITFRAVLEERREGEKRRREDLKQREARLSCGGSPVQVERPRAPVRTLTKECWGAIRKLRACRCAGEFACFVRSAYFFHISGCEAQVLCASAVPPSGAVSCEPGSLRHPDPRRDGDRPGVRGKEGVSPAWGGTSAVRPNPRRGQWGLLRR